MRALIVVCAAFAIASGYPKTDDAKDQGHINLNEDASPKYAPTILATLAKPTDEKTPLNPIEEEKSEEAKRHKKSATTTVCVEIKPTDPYHKPFQLCETGNQQYYIQEEDYKPAAIAYEPQVHSYVSTQPKPYSQTSTYQKSAPSHPSPPYSGPKPTASYTAPSPDYSPPKHPYNAPSSSSSNGPYPPPSSNGAVSKPGYPGSYRSGEESDETEHVGDEAMDEDDAEEMDSMMRSARYGGYSGYGGGYGVDYEDEDDKGKLIKFKGLKAKKKDKKGYGGHGLVITCQPNLMGYAGHGGGFGGHHGGYGGPYSGGYAADYRNSYPGGSRSYPKYKSKYGGQQGGYGSRGKDMSTVYYGAGHGFANNAETPDEGENDAGSNGASSGYGAYGASQGFGAGSSGVSGGGGYGGGTQGFGSGSSGASGSGGVYGGATPGFGSGAPAANGGGGASVPQIYTHGYYVQPQAPMIPPSPPPGAYGGNYASPPTPVQPPQLYTHQIYPPPGSVPSSYPSPASYPYGSASAVSSGASFGAPSSKYNPSVYGSASSASYTPPGTYRASEDSSHNAPVSKPIQKDVEGTVSMTPLDDKEKHTLNVMSNMAQSRASGTKWENDMRAPANPNDVKPQEAKEDHLGGKWKNIGANGSGGGSGMMSDMEAENMKKQ